MNDFWLIRTDALGNYEWDRTYGGTGEDLASSLVNTNDGGYALTGYTASEGAGGLDFWLVKTDASGNHEWNKTYGGASSDRAYSVVQTVDGGYALAGYTKSYGAGAEDFWLVKLAPEEIPATIDIDPNTLNLKSNGEWITGYIELPEGYSVNDIIAATILVNGTIPVDTEAPVTVGDYDSDGVLDLMVKFDRASIIEWLGAIDYAEATGRSCLVVLTITGEVSGTTFEGSDTINILRK